MRYDPVLIQPFRDELTRIGFTELKTPEDVDRAIVESRGTLLLVVNSVCGCAAGKARPGIAEALRRSAVKPDHLSTVFAGADLEATERARIHFGNIPPSSPSIALLKDGRLVDFIPRYQIENRNAAEIAQHLTTIFEEHCGAAERQAAS